MSSISVPITKHTDVQSTPSIKSDSLSNVNTKIPNVVAEIAETSQFPDAASDDAFDMDFSVLDDRENQFETNAKIASPLKVVSTPKAKSPIPAVDNFADILSNWDNICKTDDAIEEEMSSTIFDEPEAKGDVSFKIFNNMLLKCLANRCFYL